MMILDPKTLHPRKGHLFAETLDGDYVSAGGLYVVSGDKNPKPFKCRVISTGAPFQEDGRPQKYRAAAGDTVYIKKQAGDVIFIKMKRYIMLKNADIIAVE